MFLRSLSKLSNQDKTEDLIALGDSRQYKPRNGWTGGTLPGDKNAYKASRETEYSRHKGKPGQNTSQPVSTGDLSSILVQESSMDNTDQGIHSQITQGVSSSRLAQDDKIRGRPVGSGANGRLGSPRSNGFNGDLSSGPLSSVSDQGYIPDQSKDLSVSPTQGKIIHFQLYLGKLLIVR